MENDNLIILDEAEIIKKDLEYECIQWQSVGKASVAIANILYMEQFDPWHKEGLQLAQEIIKEYCNFLELAASKKVYIEK